MRVRPLSKLHSSPIRGNNLSKSIKFTGGELKSQNILLKHNNERDSKIFSQK